MGGSKKLTGEHAATAEKMLRNITKILDSENIPYVLEGGTLLGIIREGRLLPWDNDIDLTITRPYASKLIAIRWKFWFKGYRTRIRYNETETPQFRKGSPRLLLIQTRKFLFFKKDRLMDIFIKDLVNDRYFWTVSRVNPVLKSADRKYYEEIIPFEFKNKLYSIPKEYDSYLQARYGDWRKPLETWDYKKDDLSIEYKRNA